MAIKMPEDHQWVTSDFMSLVKMYGADDSPKGRTQNSKYLTTPLKGKEKPKYLRNSCSISIRGGNRILGRNQT